MKITLAIGFVLLQGPCWNRGSAWMAAMHESGPALQCRYAPAAPAWDLFTPPHRAAIAKPGYHLGQAREMPRLLIRYRCTGYWLVPRVIDQARSLGYVIDSAEVRC